MKLPPGERLFLALDNDNMLVPWYLMASYAYYQRDEPLLTDHTFDQICTRLDEVWDTVEHWHKHLVDRPSLAAGTCLLALEEYPRRAVTAACSILGLPEH